MTHTTIDQTALIHDDLSFCNDLELSDGAIDIGGDINVLEYRWIAVHPGVTVEGVTASWRGLKWQGVRQ